MSKSRVDIFTYLLLSSEDDPRNPTISDGDLIYDSELAVVAGSDTTSTTMAAIIYLLAKNPEKQNLLQQEVDQTLGNPEDLSYRNIAGKTPLLDGCINEALRMYPAAPSGLQRLTSPEGAIIAGKMVPGDTLVSTPPYTLHRDPRNFTDPECFIPERWSSQGHLVKAKDAFIPFSIGPYSCVGKNLAMMEMRMLLACLVCSFSFRFPDNQEAAIVEAFESGYKDHITGQLAKFEVLISRRTRA
ncbi:uncharacterized protein LDX57_002639 [Aspergillus melleus]|uniref:uncharacterized protein n=1 Tax=Aspergillus melleus TaxID=138277 RepID=UPI001E8E78C3|nr:uncharacterized protein LDX57_002639 [Aspergillus melleus]KAH8424894.1 hypothetical protein LDX57_002639 [Aspergillus melleus]